MQHLNSTKTDLTLNEDKIAFLQSKLWTPALDKLLRRWKRQIDIRRRGHFEVSREYNKKHYLLGIPATILTTLTSTGTLTTFQYQGKNNLNETQINSFIAPSSWGVQEYILLIMGILGLLGAVLVGLMTFLNYQEASQENKTATDEYESLHGTIETILSVPIEVRGNPVDVLKNIKDQYDIIVKKSPSLPKKYSVELGYDVVNESPRSNFTRVYKKQPRDKSPINPDDIEPKNKNSRSPGINILKRIIDDSPSITLKVSSEIKPEDLKNLEINKNTPNRQNNRLSTPINTVIIESVSDDDSDEEITYRNNFDTDDDEEEVCIPFDVDRVAAMSNKNSVLAAINMSIQNDRNAQESLIKVLKEKNIRPSDEIKKPKNKIKPTKLSGSSNTENKSSKVEHDDTTINILSIPNKENNITNDDNINKEQPYIINIIDTDDVVDNLDNNLDNNLDDNVVDNVNLNQLIDINIEVNKSIEEKSEEKI